MNIKKTYQDLVLTSIILNFFDALLTALAVMAVSYAVIYFYRINYLFAIAVAVAFFIRSFYRKIRQNKILLLENQYPNLKERLRTSYDNQDSSGTVVNSLHSDIHAQIEKVDVNAYLNPKRLSIKVAAICILMFLTLYFSSVGFDILDLKTRVMHSAIYQKINSAAKDLFDKPGELEGARPKLSEPRLLDTGNKDMNVTIDTYNTKLDITEIEQGEKNDFGGHYPDEVKGASQETYEEDIPEEHKETIKDYFGKINK
jgi:membrane protein implicated in regulation of membrane protease activity